METSHRPPLPPDAGLAASAPADHGNGAIPGLYALLLVLTMVVAFGYKLRTQGVFACPVASSTGNDYLAYCNATAFGDYDRGAFRYALEPGVRQAAASADVLFLGSSRMQFALSSQATTDWFARAQARHYLLGFSHTENVVFTAPLLADLRPQARVYVINVDRFFDERITPPTREILQDKDVVSRYREKRFWQSLHRPVCTALPSLCGDALTFVRFREAGHWELRGSTGQLPTTGVSDGPARDREKWGRFASIARDFVGRLPVDRDCVILTIAPSDGTMIDEAQSIADALSLPLVSPRPESLRTFDASHLDRPSAERWSAAFFEAAGDQITRCLGKIPNS
jgi:hypothetical protein